MARAIKTPVELRVDAAITYLLTERSSEKISIASICRWAEVSRSTLYEHHPELVKTIKAKITKDEPRRQQPSNSKKLTRSLVEEKKRLSRQVRALTLVCLEQKLEIQSMASDIARLEERLKHKR